MTALPEHEGVPVVRYATEHDRGQAELDRMVARMLDMAAPSGESIDRIRLVPGPALEVDRPPRGRARRCASQDPRRGARRRVPDADGPRDPGRDHRPARGAEDAPRNARHAGARHGRRGDQLPFLARPALARDRRRRPADPRGGDLQRDPGPRGGRPREPSDRVLHPDARGGAPWPPSRAPGTRR